MPKCFIMGYLEEVKVACSKEFIPFYKLPQDLLDKNKIIC